MLNLFVYAHLSYSKCIRTVHLHICIKSGAFDGTYVKILQLYRYDMHRDETHRETLFFLSFIMESLLPSQCTLPLFTAPAAAVFI